MILLPAPEKYDIQFENAKRSDRKLLGLSNYAFNCGICRINGKILVWLVYIDKLSLGYTIICCDGANIILHNIPTTNKFVFPICSGAHTVTVFIDFKSCHYFIISTWYGYKEKSRLFRWAEISLLKLIYFSAHGTIYINGYIEKYFLIASHKLNSFFFMFFF
jgi:hypothetical protein